MPEPPDRAVNAPEGGAGIRPSALSGLHLCREVPDLLASFAELLASVARFDSAGVALLDAARRRLRVHETGDPPDEERSLPLGGTAASTVLRDDGPLRLVQGGNPEAGSVAPFFRAAHAVVLMVPLRVDGRPLGTLQLASDQPDGLGAAVEAAVRELAPHLAVALENVQRYSRARRSEDRYRALLENAPDAVLIFDVDQRRLVEVNARALEVTGYRRSELMSMDTDELHDRLGEAVRFSRLRSLLREGRIRFESQLVRADDRPIPVQIHATLIRLGGERVVECEIRDISDLIREKRFKSAYEQMREFSAVSSSILQEKDLDRICEMFAQALREHSNYRRAILTLLDDQFRGYKWFFAGLDAEEIGLFHQNRLTSDQRVTIFQERFRLGNSYYIAHDSGWNYVGVPSSRGVTEMVDWHPDDFLFIPLYGSNRKMVGIVSVDDPRDGSRPTAETISPIELFANQVAHSIEQAKLDQEVRRSTEKYRTLVDSMNDGLLAVDLTNRVTFVNPALMALLGYSEHAILGRSIHQFLTDSSQEPFRREVRQRERRTRFEVTMQPRVGEGIPVMVSASPFYQNGELVGTFAIVSDLREQKKADAAFQKMHHEIVETNERLKGSMEDLRRAQEQLIQAEKLSALGELISGVAHELNNPLTGVMGFSQLLLGSPVPEPLRKNLEKIHTEAVRCQKIVQNLLTFARRRAPERGPVQINEILEATLDLRAYQLKVDNIEVVRELDEKLPATTGDFHQLQQVFINVINNAHHAMLDTHGRGRLVVRTARAGGGIRVSFHDDGPGISEDKLGKIFDPFFTTKEVGKGTGLGLSLSYGIVKEHDGRIWAESSPGRGATFVVELPVRDHAAVAAAGEGAEEPAPGPGSKRILVVDDEEVILDLLESILVSGGHRVETARNGRIALQKLKAGRYDLIISDLKMPDIGGQLLWESVREIDPEMCHRMIFSTGDTVNPSTQAFFQRTGNFYLSKPFRLEEVDRTIRQALARVHPSAN